MSDDLEVSQVHTVCRDCVFAQYNGKEQTGCKLDKIKDYENAGVDVIKVFDDKEKEFFLIDGRFCMFYRNEELMAKHPVNTWEKIVNLQTKVSYQSIVFVEKETTFKELKKTLNTLSSQEVRPNLVTIINKQYPYYFDEPENYVKPSLMLELLEDYKFHQFSLKNVYDMEMDDRALVDLVFDGTKDKPYPFYITFRAGFAVPENFSKEFNDAILIKMLQLGFVEPIDDINGMIVNKIAHKKHGGNSFGIAIEKKIIAYEEDSEKFIFKVGDVCPSMK
jgi:hypothetical protein